MDSTYYSNSSDDDLDDLLSLLNIQWTIFEASSIYNINHQNLTRYGRQCSRLLKNEFNSSRDQYFKCIFKYCSKLKYSTACKDGLKVIVTTGNDDVIYLAYLLDWGITEDTSKDEQRLPIVFVNAKASVSLKVNNVLCRLFDCNIQRVALNMKTLVTLCALLVQYSDDTINGIVKLKYSVPGVDSSNLITIELPLKNLSTLLKVVKEKSPEDVEIEEPFYAKLMNHLCEVYRIRFFHLPLESLQFRGAQIFSSGKVKMNDLEVVSPILVVLQSVMKTSNCVRSTFDQSVDSCIGSLE